MSILQRIMYLVTRDLTGKTFNRESTHPYFGTIQYYGWRDEPAKSYWEAGLDLPGINGFSITFDGTPDGPTPAEVSFCKSLVEDLDALFERCRPSFQIEYANWVDTPFSTDWRGTFVLDGITLPHHGDPDAPWDVCYFVEPAGHWFTAEFEHGQVQRVTVDG